MKTEKQIAKIAPWENIVDRLDLVQWKEAAMEDSCAT
jgi:hypothetical protein